MKIIKYLITITILMTTALAFTGCTTFDNFKAAFVDKQIGTQEEIQIGVLEPVTGVASKEAAEEIRGIQMANEVHPSVNGQKISLVFSDDKSDIDATETAVQTLIEKKPIVILGSYGNVYSLAASPYIRAAKIPAIAITNTNPLITRNNPYYCRVCYVDSDQGALLARYVLESQKQDTAGVLIPRGDDAALAKASSFTKKMKAETGNEDAVSYYEKYSTGQKDFTKQLTKLSKSGVKNVILPGDYIDCANIVNQAARMGLDVKFLGDSTWGTDEFKALLNKNVKPYSMAFIQFFATDTQNSKEAMTKERDRFLKVYTKKYGSKSEPTDAMALGYDAYFVAIDAISKAGDNATSEDVNKILDDPSYTYEGATGSIIFNEYGDPEKTAYISTWQNGKMATIYTIEATQ